MHLIEVWEDNVLIYRIQITSKRIFYMYSIVLYNRVLGNNYFIIVITILYFNEKIKLFLKRFIGITVHSNTWTQNI